MLSILFTALCLSACGGGGGGPAAEAETLVARPQVAVPDSATGPVPVVGAPVDANSTPSTATSASVSAEVGTARALSATASVSLDGVPNAPLAAPLRQFDLQGRNFFIDSRHGDDAADGRLAHEAMLASEPGRGPWRSLARLMTAAMQPGDTVVLACGSVWRETLSLPANGTAALPIMVTAPVGCTSPPAIDGRVSLPPSAWTQHIGSIYKAALNDAALQVFSESGLFTAAHHPNNGTVTADLTSPYLAMVADGNALATGNGSNVGSTVLNAGVEFANLAANAATPARVRVRINQYIVDDLPVSRFEGTQIVLQRATEHQARAGWGYFLLGQLWMLDSPGEWHFDPTSKQLYAWMPNSSAPTSAVSVSVLNTGVNLQGREHIMIDGLAVRGVGLGMDLRSSKSVQLRNSRIEDTADVGVLTPGSTQAVIESNLIARTGGDAITGWGVAMGNKLSDAASSIVRNNLIRDSGVLLQGEQVVSLPRRSVAAIYVGANSTVSGNTIVNAGYLGIFANANNTVTQNFVFGACSVLDDCAGIYTAGLNNNSQIRGNTVVRSRGMLAGQPMAGRSTAAQGIYIDDDGSGVVVEDNTVVDTDHGVLLHNASKNTVSGNRLYGNRKAQIWLQEDANKINANGDVSGNVIETNQIAAVSPTSMGVLLTSRFANTSAFARFGANRYFDRAAATVVASSSAGASSLHNLSQWRASTDVGSTQAVDTVGTGTSLRGYGNYSVSGINLVANSALELSAEGWGSWNQTAPAGQMTREACPAGTCLRYVAGGSAGVLTSPSFAVQQGRWYRLSVDVSTEADNQAVPLVLRAGAPSYVNASDRKLSFTGNRAWARHAVIFQATQTLDGSAAAGGAWARVDIDGIQSGRSLRIAQLELVPISVGASAQSSGVFINAGSSARSLTCPFAGSAPAATSAASLCGNLFNLADDRPITWPLSVPPRSAVIAYAQDVSLLDADGDGIPDSQDSCASSAPGVAVNAAGCEFAAR